MKNNVNKLKHLNTHICLFINSCFNSILSIILVVYKGIGMILLMLNQSTDHSFWHYPFLFEK